jgi:hypothetical protein
LAFPDDELDPAPRGRGAGGPPGQQQRQIFLRRLIALGAGVLALIVLVLGINSCLDARKERGFENYVSDLNSAITRSNQLSARVFEGLLTPPEGQEDPLALEGNLSTYRGEAEAILSQIEGLDVPDEVAGAQDDLVKAFELRRDALTGIADQIPAALGEEGRDDAINAIAFDMRMLLASDVLYAEAQGEINTALEEQAIDATIEESIFLPPPEEQWLDPSQMRLILNQFAAAATNITGTHGLALVSTTLDNTDLIAGSENSVRLDGPVELEVLVSNEGDANETDVVVTAEISGTSGVIEATGTISRIQSLDSEEATLRFEEEPLTETPLTLTVTAQSVLGEELIDNNTATYPITFE